MCCWSTDVVVTLVKGKKLDWNNARLNIGMRLDYADYNMGRFISTGGNIADDIWALIPMVAFRPIGQTVIRFN